MNFFRINYYAVPTVKGNAQSEKKSADRRLGTFCYAQLGRDVHFSMRMNIRVATPLSCPDLDTEF